jgi:hypothetical protein
LATLVACLGWYAHDHPHVSTAPVLSPAAAGIHPGQALPDLDPNGDPVWLPIPAPSASPIAASLPQGLYAGTTGVSLSPIEATDVLSAVWRLRTQALTNNQESLLAAIESGPALEADLGAMISGSSIPTGGFTTSSVIVPAQVGWPRDFLAEAMTHYAGSSWTEILVFERAAAAQPWKVVLASGFANSGIPEFAQPARAGVNAGTSSGEAALPGILAADWQAATDTGNTATDFASGTWSIERETSLARHRQGELAVNGLVGHYVYQAGSADESFTFATQGSTFSCGVVRVQETWTPPPGRPISSRTPGVTPGARQCRPASTGRLSRRGLRSLALSQAPRPRQ